MYPCLAMALTSVGAGSLVGERLGKYHLLALIAIGGTAEIYLARIAGEAGFEKYVVVKCLLDHLADDADFVRMFLDEARLCAQLDHSNIVQTLELGQHEGRYYMVMEHLAGISLAQLARKTHERLPEGVIPARIVLGLAAQTCAGLHYAHQRTGTDGSPLNVVHRDVSPQNLVVTFEGMLKIVDFGIAKADLRQTHTRSGTIKGKFAYMSPEQCLAEPVDRRTDVFALGTVVHELLTARRLFKRVNTYETYQAILKGNPPPPSRFNQSVDEELDRVVLRALAYHREDRHDTAEAFGEEMLSWLHSRSQSVSATDVARYVETVCGVEIEQHAAHMRELISGGRHGASQTMLWDSMGEGSESESVSLGASPLTSDGGLGLDDMAGTDYDEPSEDEDEPRIAPHMSQREHEDDFGADTQIELDPMERVAELEAAAAAAAAFRAEGPVGRGERAVRSAPGSAPSLGDPVPRVARGFGPAEAGEPGAGGGLAPGRAGAEALAPDGRRVAVGPGTEDATAGDGRTAGGSGDGLESGRGAGEAGIAGASGGGVGSGEPGGSIGGPGWPPDMAHFPPAALRPHASNSVGAGSPAVGLSPADRRGHNDLTVPEMLPGQAHVHDHLTSPESAMPGPGGAAGSSGSNPLAVYDTPPPPRGQAPMWGDDRSDGLHQGGVPSPPPHPPHAPDHASRPLPHERPTLLRPPPARAMQFRGPSPVPRPDLERPPLWLLAAAFLISAGLGLGLTILIGSLIA